MGGISSICVILLQPAPSSQPETESFVPSIKSTFTSLSGASFAVCMDTPVIVVAPIPGVTTKPEGALFAPSKFKYFVGCPSIALATPSEPGLLAELANTASPGDVTSFGALPPSSSTSAICMQQVLGPCVSTAIHL